MASRVRSRRRYWRDVPMAVVFFGWIAGAAGLFYGVYAVDWSSFGGGFGSGFSGRQQAQQARTAADDDRIYTGSILVPENRSRCWQYGFDNRNGTMWNVGSVDCYEASLQFILKEQSKGLSDERLLAIRKSLHRGK